MGQSQDPLTFWLNNAGRYPLLATDEVFRLSKNIQEHGPESQIGKKALDKLVRHNLRLVPVVTKKVINTRKDFKFGDNNTLDLLQAGTFGLHRAALRFDYARGYKFSTYAYMWIRQTVQRQMYALSSLMHVPESYFRNYVNLDDPAWQAELLKDNPRSYEYTVCAYRALKPYLTIEIEGERGEQLLRNDDSLHTDALGITDSIDFIFGLSETEIDPKHKAMVKDVYCNNIPIAHVAEANGMTKQKAVGVLRKTLETLKKQSTIKDYKKEYFT